MFLFLKSLSRSVHDEELNDQEPDTKIVRDGTPTSLTVWRKSLILNCSGFTVINSHGDLVYRVDNYRVHPNELILMNGSGKAIFTMHRRKKLGFGDNWVVYEGEVGQCCLTKPIWCVTKHRNIVLTLNKNVLAYVFRDRREKRHSYVIEGCYRNRSCKVLDESRRVVAEIKRKEAMISGISFGVEVFVLVVQPGFDPGFAMALVLLLDQMFP